jgi:hypothetical protein
LLASPRSIPFFNFFKKGDSAMFENLMKEDILAEVRTYKLLRGEKSEGIFISVHKIIAGEYKNKFIAQPNLIVHFAPKEYYGIGDTEIEALNDCFAKIKDKDLIELFS